MNAMTNPNRVSWIEEVPPHPLCDVPWLGTAMVLSDGQVNFCCFSDDAVIGNVNQEPFEKIWNGRKMQAIRHELSEHRLPRECHSTKCPIYRGDELSLIQDRMEGPHSRTKCGTDDPHAGVRERLQGSALWTSQNLLQPGDTIDVGVNLRYNGSPTTADLFLSIHRPDGLFHFMPHYEEYAVPFLCDIKLIEKNVLQPRLNVRSNCFKLRGSYSICAALFEAGSNPNLLSNCYWSEIRTVIMCM